MPRIAEPNVEVIAHTTLREGNDHLAGLVGEGADMEVLAEFAGRACYQSFHRPSEATNTTKKYLNRTLHEQKHWSIAEHASVTFYITGVSRAFTHELVRHRHLSFSQLSQRFVNEDDANIVLPPAVAAYMKKWEESEMLDTLTDCARFAMDDYCSLANELASEGLPRKKAREAARAVLPNMTETRIVVTGNLRAWKEVCDRRMQPDVDAETREVVTMIHNHLHTLAPTTFPKETR